jgi:hypothetical protein
MLRLPVARSSVLITVANVTKKDEKTGKTRAVLLEKKRATPFKNGPQ